MIRVAGKIAAIVFQQVCHTFYCLLIRSPFVKYITFSLNSPLEEPKMISALSGKQAGKHVTHIACGSTYSAAITAEGELYTWGRGNYGRLGHGMLLDIFK